MTIDDAMCKCMDEQPYVKHESGMNGEGKKICPAEIRTLDRLIKLVYYTNSQPL